jgi:glycerol kinase
MHRNILAIDQGTTGSTALIINQDLQILGCHTVDFPQHFPHPSWVEHDLNEIWSSVTTAVEKVLEKTHTSANDIAAIGLTNQRQPRGVG